METKRVILARFADFDVTPTKCYHGNRMSDLKKNSLFDEKVLKNQFLELFPSILLFLPFS